MNNKKIKNTDGKRIENKDLINNIPIEIIKTTKFKDIIIKIIFCNDYTKENATRYNLLMALLNNSSKKYNTKTKVMNIKGKLFNANVYFSTTHIHKTRVSVATLNVINEKYTNDPSLLQDSLRFLYEMLLKPNIKDNKFDTKAFNEEKKLYENEIKKLNNDKNRYALRRTIYHMCPDEVIGINILGDLEGLNSLSEEDLYYTYLDLLNNSMKKIYVIGNVDNSIISKLQMFKKLQSQDMFLDKVYKENKEVTSVKEINEKGEVNQTILLMGYRTTIDNCSDEFEAYQVFVEMLGGMVTSNLFTVIREENSLCYSISASLIGDAKIMLVNAGIDKENSSKTIELVKQEFKKYQDGIVDNELLDSAKATLISEINETDDIPSEIISQRIINGLLELPLDNKSLIQRINKVTKEDVIKASKKVYLDTIYLFSN